MFYLAYKFTHFQWHKQYCPATPSPPATYAKSGAPGSAPDNSQFADYQPFTRQPSQVLSHFVAGQTPNCRRSGGKPSQVCKNRVTCDANRPQEQKNVAGPAKNTDLRHFEASPATLQRCTEAPRSEAARGSLRGTPLNKYKKGSPDPF